MKYMVQVGAWVGRGIIVEADSIEEAAEKVWDHPDIPGSLCHQCSDQVGDLGDLDIPAKEDGSLMIEPWKD